MVLLQQSWKVSVEITGFFDGSKAFDKVLIHGLIVKLIDKIFPYHFISILEMCNYVEYDDRCWFSGTMWCATRRCFISIAIYIDDIIVQMRNSGFGIRIGSTFAGCLLHADDIVLISCSYYGLQKLINVCEMYGKVWDIKFNPLKGQVVTFGGQRSNAIEITMEDSIIPRGGRVKYLGCYFSGPSGEVDLSQSVSKFYG